MSELEIDRIPLPTGVTLAVQTGGPAPSRYRISINMSAQNLTNHVNYTGFTGTRSSPFFGQATSAQNARKIDVGIALSF